MKAEIITIGDELLIGQVIDTNSAWLAEQLNTIGIEVVQITSINDKKQAIFRALNRALEEVSLILITGGLGPTNDDITKHTLCSYFNTELVLNQTALQNIEHIFSSRNLPVTEVNRQQAMLPKKCKIIPNANGTAAGMYFKEKNVNVISMPGVPFEMKAMFVDSILPMLRGQSEHAIFHKTILTEGIGESFLADKISDWEQALPKHIKLAYLPQPGIVRLRLSASGSNQDLLENEVAQQVQLLQGIIGEYIFGFDEETLPQIVGKLLTAKGKTLCTAESCTGGYLAHLITGESSSSQYFKGAVVAYDNAVKESFLNVKPQTLKDFGAVSAQTAEEMAANARKQLKTDFAIATTGIAGPTGATSEKPVGLVYIAIATAKKTTSHKFLLGNHRGRNIHRTAIIALNLLRKAIMN